ncbi:MAG: phosphoenolpyruvate carboxylase [Planctomycetota bacterium]
MFNRKGLTDEELIALLPKTMGTQHPDNASKAPFSESSKVDVGLEGREICYVLSQLGLDEVMLDYEGKKGECTPLIDFLEIDPEFFKKNLLGHKVHVTPRIPNPDISRDDPNFYQSLGPFVNSLLILKKLGVPGQAFNEFIVPDATDGRRIAVLEGYLLKLLSLHKGMYAEFGDGTPFPCTDDFFVQGIPLIETVENLTKPERIWSQLVEGRREITGVETHVQRSLIARSDPALKAGMVPGIMAASVALSRGVAFEKKTGIRMPQIIGCGSAPFRGGLTPSSIVPFLRTYPGIATVTLQSAFRYDNPPEKVKGAAEELRRLVAAGWLGREERVVQLTADEIEEIRSIFHRFRQDYEKSVEELGDLLLDMAEQVPRNRDRFKISGLFGYGRTVAGRPAPRAIAFSASLYSLGIPPGILGLRAMAGLSGPERALVYKTNPMIDHWIREETRWLNRESLSKIDGLNAIREDAEVARNLAPDSSPDPDHLETTSRILALKASGKELTPAIVEAAMRRGFLG